MLIISTIFAPLWYPLRYQLGLLRSLSSGMQVPGTNLVLVPYTGSSRFNGLEKWILAVAGAWLVLRLASCDFRQAIGEMLKAIYDKQISYKEVKNKHHEGEEQENPRKVTTTINNHEQQQQDQQEEVMSPSSDGGMESTNMETYSSTDNDDTEEQIFYWRSLPGGEKPMFCFTAKELDLLLQLPLSVDYNDSPNSDVDEEGEEDEEGDEDEEMGDEEDSQDTESTESDAENEDDYEYIEVSSPVASSQEQDSETEYYEGDEDQGYEYSSQESLENTEDSEDDAGGHLST
ncbi:protein ENDO16-like [Drosophila tropicalis]|uniref:protein ENDO16-like n=1 Tax=Drosophila tropicalis TaxID=46794 RepID=UPI0035ABB75F